MSEILDFTPEKRLLKPSIIDVLLYKIITLFSLYFALFGKLFGVSYRAILSILTITLFGIKNGYSLDNIRAIIGQARLETADFTSPMAIKDYNIFGMHFPFVRDTYCSHARWNASENADVCVYKSYLDSVLDRFHWETQWTTIPINRNAPQYDYMDAVNTNYNASTSNYMELWLNKVNEKPSQFDKVCYSIIASVVLPLLIINFKPKP